MTLFGKIFYQISDCLFVPVFCQFADYLWLFLENSIFRNVWQISCLNVNFCCAAWYSFFSPRLRTSWFNQKSAPLHHWSVLLRGEFYNFSTLDRKLEQFYQHTQPLGDAMQKKIGSLEFVQSVNFEVIVSLEKTVQSVCWFLTINVATFAFQKSLLLLLLQEVIVDWELFTLNTICFIKAKVEEMLSSKTRTWFFSNVPVIWFKSKRLVHIWGSDQS